MQPTWLISMNNATGLLAKRQFAEALWEFDRAVLFADDPVDKSLCMIERASCHFAVGNFGAAAEDGEKALPDCHTPQMTLRALRILTMACHELKDPQRPIGSLRSLRQHGDARTDFKLSLLRSEFYEAVLNLIAFHYLDIEPCLGVLARALQCAGTPPYISFPRDSNHVDALALLLENEKSMQVAAQILHELVVQHWRPHLQDNRLRSVINERIFRGIAAAFLSLNLQVCRSLVHVLQIMLEVDVYLELCDPLTKLIYAVANLTVFPELHLSILDLVKSVIVRSGAWRAALIENGFVFRVASIANSTVDEHFRSVVLEVGQLLMMEEPKLVIPIWSGLNPEQQFNLRNRLLMRCTCPSYHARIGCLDLLLSGFEVQPVCTAIISEAVLNAERAFLTDVVRLIAKDFRIDMHIPREAGLQLVLLSEHWPVDRRSIAAFAVVGHGLISAAIAWALLGKDSAGYCCLWSSQHAVLINCKAGTIVDTIGELFGVETILPTVRRAILLAKRVYYGTCHEMLQWFRSNVVGRADRALMPTWSPALSRDAYALVVKQLQCSGPESFLHSTQMY
eukprot:TRINITY_DN3947_c0_g1_i1.p1 TRINITY_DN3947_c0_g1~~TRINITY_DN3947_c0_g1_i1.p1  ORF type:complete len:566 (-),score=48.87 TRINITY_DN3947_c0_g1_i1:1189-2886(-)